MRKLNHSTMKDLGCIPNEFIVTTKIAFMVLIVILISTEAATAVTTTETGSGIVWDTNYGITKTGDTTTIKDSDKRVDMVTIDVDNDEVFNRISKWSNNKPGGIKLNYKWSISHYDDELLEGSACGDRDDDVDWYYLGFLYTVLGDDIYDSSGFLACKGPEKIDYSVNKSNTFEYIENIKQQNMISFALETEDFEWKLIGIEDKIVIYSPTLEVWTDDYREYTTPVILTEEQYANFESASLSLTITGRRATSETPSIYRTNIRVCKNGKFTGAVCSKGTGNCNNIPLYKSDFRYLDTDPPTYSIALGFKTEPYSVQLVKFDYTVDITTIDSTSGTGTLSITTTPISGDIYVDHVWREEGSWSGTLPVGSHEVYFGTIDGYLTPHFREVVVNKDQQTKVVGKYIDRSLADKHDVKIKGTLIDYIRPISFPSRPMVKIEEIIKDPIKRFHKEDVVYVVTDWDTPATIDQDGDIGDTVEVYGAYGDCSSIPLDKTEHYFRFIDTTGSIKASASCPVNLHAYDYQGKHTGVNSTDGTDDLQISDSDYTGSDSDPEEILILSRSENIIFKIEALDEGEFDLTITQNGASETKKITYESVSVIETTEATVDVSQENPTYIMEIDDDGDGTPEHETLPDLIETMEPTQCPLDVNDDNYVNAQDIVYLLTHGEWGSNQDHVWDLNGDGYVNAQDVVYALTHGQWGACP